MPGQLVLRAVGRIVRDNYAARSGNQRNVGSSTYNRIFSLLFSNSFDSQGESVMKCSNPCSFSNPNDDAITGKLFPPGL
jgi:hypothetical protein